MSKPLHILCIVFVLLLSLVFAPAAMTVSATPEQSEDKSASLPEYAEDKVIVRFQPNTSEKDKEQIKKENGVQLLKKFSLTDSELLMITEKEKVHALIDKLQKNPKILYAEPDYLYKADIIPNDPYFGNLWGLNNSNDVDIDAPEAWNITQGASDFVVAVIDEGIDINHPDIAANIWTNQGEIPDDGIDNDGNGFVDDVNGWDFYHNDKTIYDAADGDDHGTHVAGTIAALANNSLGTAGVAPKVKILPIKFLGPYGGYISDAVSAIEYAKKMGVRVASNSWGGDSYSTLLRDTINGFNGVFVAAAGNNGRNTDLTAHYPSSYDCSNIISVAAVDNQGSLASFSNYGTSTVDVGAPGVNIYSLIPGASYQSYSGTSMATPHVSGIAALMLGMNPSLLPAEVCSLIKQTTSPQASLQGKTASGGLVNALEPVLAVKGPGPYVTNSDPADRAEEVPLDKVISVNFNENIQAGDTFDQITLKTVSGTVNAAASISNNVLTIVPSGLENDTCYTVVLPSESVKNAEGYGLKMSYSLSFFTPDTAAPAVSSSDPADGATGVDIYSSIIVKFTEDIKEGWNFGGISIDGTPINGGQYGTGIYGSNLYIYPYQQFAYNTQHTVSIPEGALSDKENNLLKIPYSFSFTTAPDIFPPIVNYCNPYPGAENVSTSKVISLYFSENISAGESYDTIAVSSTGSNVVLNKSINDNILSLQPVDKLQPNTSYQVVIPAGAVVDACGNPLENDYSLSFMTGKFDFMELPYYIDDAVIDPVQPIIYLLSKMEGKLHTYNYSTGAVSEVSFGYVPACMDIGQGVSSNELYVALGSQPAAEPISGQETQACSIAVIDTATLNIIDNISLGTGFEAFDLVAGRDEYIYVTSADGQWTSIKSYNLSTGAQTSYSTIRQMSFAELHPILDRIYTIDTDLSPRDYTAYNVSQGTFLEPSYPGGYDSPYHGDYPLDINFAIDPTGKYIFNGSGTIFACAQEKLQDMKYISTLDNGFADIAFDPDLKSFYTLPWGSSALNIYSGAGFKRLSTLELAVQGVYLFKQGNNVVVIGNSESPGGYGTGIQVVDLPDLAPEVVDSLPANLSSNVPIGQQITVTFSENIVAGSNYSNVCLKDCNGVDVPKNCSINNNILSILPQGLNYSTVYSLTIPTGAVKDLSGGELAADFVLNFTTESNPDTVPPAVMVSDPADGAKDIPVNKVITVNFSEDVITGPAFEDISLKDAVGTSVSITKNVSAKTLTINPGTLEYSTGYTLFVPAGAVKDQAGNAFANSYSIGFSTEAEPDTICPSIVSTVPEDSQVVNKDSNISLTFSENIVAGNTYDLILLKDKDGNFVQFSKSISGNTLNLTNPELNYNTNYILTVPESAVKDQAGNGLAAGYTLNFKTEAQPDTIAPVIISTVPDNKDINQLTNIVITVTFSENVQLGSNAGNITIKKGKTPIGFNISISENKLMLDPTLDLARNSTYVVTIPSGAVIDLAGNTLGSGYTFSFTTGRK